MSLSLTPMPTSLRPARQSFYSPHSLPPPLALNISKLCKSLKLKQITVEMFVEVWTIWMDIWGLSWTEKSGPPPPQLQDQLECPIRTAASSAVKVETLTFQDVPSFHKAASGLFNARAHECNW
ncbi:hypothetical protein B9479_005174 [Cryptococcus floricola]|uniref:Uncharacterized protein n=1 Tax=Cryptococcus floricola TaxID=2591691 RepID=A0A5D3AVG5_9TREE|nr:hypothetical protein B9479_005174 [Cryptococcus floricola]